MATWVNHAYMEQADPAARLAMARAYLTEINAEIQANVSAGSMSRTNDSLLQLRASVREDIKDLEKLLGVGAGTMTSPVMKAVMGE